MGIRITGFGSVVKNFFNKLFAHAFNVKFVAWQPAKPFARTQEPRVVVSPRGLKFWPMLANTVFRAAAGLLCWANQYRFHCYNIPHKSSVVKGYFEKVIHRSKSCSHLNRNKSYSHLNRNNLARYLLRLRLIRAGPPAGRFCQAVISISFGGGGRCVPHAAKKRSSLKRGLPWAKYAAAMVVRCSGATPLCAALIREATNSNCFFVIVLLG